MEKSSQGKHRGHRHVALVGLALGLLMFVASAGAASAAANAQLESLKRALLRAGDATIGIEATAVEDAGSIESLGRQRRGSGVVIGADGLVLTIGYLILEADHVDLLLAGDRRVPARVVAYDLATGFGLLQALAPMPVQPALLGSAARLAADDAVMIASGGESSALGLVRLVSQRPFSGYWEYHIEGALFTSPPRGDHSGAGLFNTDGELIGIGSLVVTDAAGPGRPPLAGNMFVPVDLLKPILGEMRSEGASHGSVRPWLGLNCVESEDGVRVVKASTDSPAEHAGLRPGDQIVRIDGADVTGLESFYKTLWHADSAERDVTLDIRRDGQDRTLKVRALDRMKTLVKPHGI